LGLLHGVPYHQADPQVGLSSLKPSSTHQNPHLTSPSISPDKAGLVVKRVGLVEDVSRPSIEQEIVAIGEGELVEGEASILRDSDEQFPGSGHVDILVCCGQVQLDYPTHTQFTPFLPICVQSERVSPSGGHFVPSGGQTRSMGSSLRPSGGAPPPKGWGPGGRESQLEPSVLATIDFCVLPIAATVCLGVGSPTPRSGAVRTGW